MKPKIHSLENDVLSTQSTSVYENSRLACGIRLKPWMNEIIITQPRYNEPSSHYTNYDLDIDDDNPAYIDTPKAS
jgi:hypothetical protein